MAGKPQSLQLNWEPVEGSGRQGEEKSPNFGYPAMAFATVWREGRKVHNANPRWHWEIALVAHPGRLIASSVRTSKAAAQFEAEHVLLGLNFNVINLASADLLDGVISVGCSILGRKNKSAHWRHIMEMPTPAQAFTLASISNFMTATFAEWEDAGSGHACTSMCFDQCLVAAAVDAIRTEQWDQVELAIRGLQEYATAEDEFVKAVLEGTGAALEQHKKSLSAEGAL